MSTFCIPFALLISAAALVSGNPFLRVAELARLDHGNQNAADSGMTKYRLPDDTKPISYKLRMVPYLAGNFDNFTGTAEIEIQVQASTKDVYLNSRNLTVTRVSFISGRRVLPATVTMEPGNERIKLSTRYSLVVGFNYKINITFAGILNDKMRGFYRSSYKIGNETRWLATTQFEPTFARQAFPCYDEPGYKTPFTISVARPAIMKALSNMPLKNTSEPDPATHNYVWDTFETTPPMPTYLVAFIVANFSYVTESSRKFSVWSRENAIDDTKYILNEGQRLLKQMENFTGVRYNLPKMDLAAIPDFAAGAMENWGLTTYRERYITFNPKVCPARSMEMVTTVVAHELSHQWFGDYVTPTWWDYVWLNEAFATYFEWHITAEVEPTWRMDQTFVVEVVQPALFVDEAYHHHAMTSPVQTPTEIKSVFDFIIYDKGGSVLRMLEHMIGTANYKNALNVYLTKGHQSGGSVTPLNLFEALEEVIYEKHVHLPPDTGITCIMKNWTENRGYPLMNVARLSSGKMANITIQQETYKSPRSKVVTPDQYWAVPLTCTTQSKLDFNNTEPAFWSLPGKSTTLKNAVDANEWILCNIQQTGYYRVKYDDENWKLLIKQLHSKHAAIHPLNRAQLIDDSASLAIDHKLPFVIPLELMQYLPNESDPIPLFAALKSLNYLYNKYSATPLGPMLEHYIIGLVKPLYNRFGFDPKPTDDHVTKNLRSALVSFACVLKIEACLVAAKNEYAKNKNDLSRINAEVKGAVFCAMLNTESKQTVWSNMWTLFRTSNVAWELETTLLSFGCAEDTLLKQLMYKLVDQNDTEIRSQYHFYIYRAVFSTPNGVMAVFKLLDDMLPQWSNLSRNSVEMLETFIDILGDKMDTEEQMKLMNKTIITVEKLDQKVYGKVLDGLKKAQNSSLERGKLLKMTGEKLSAALQSIFQSTTTSPPHWITTSSKPEPTTVKPSSATTNTVSSVFVSAFVSLVFYHFSRV